MGTKVIQLLRDLRSAVLSKLSDEEGSRHLLKKIRKSGLSVYLVVDDGGEEDPEAIPLVLSKSQATEERPLFRIDHRDLRILRDLGIDPTRTLRRRR